MIHIKQLFILMLLVLLNVGLVANAQTYTRSGNTFISSTGERVKANSTKTKFIWKDTKGKEYPIYVSNTGSCFVIRTSSKTNKEYKSYLGKDLSQQICKELNITYKRIRKENNYGIFK